MYFYIKQKPVREQKPKKLGKHKWQIVQVQVLVSINAGVLRTFRFRWMGWSLLFLLNYLQFLDPARASTSLIRSVYREHATGSEYTPRVPESTLTFGCENVS